MTRLRRRLSEESGIALPLALALMAILAFMTAALTLNGAVNQRGSLNSADARAAFALATKAMAYGQGAVFAAASDGGTPPSTAQPVDAPSGSSASWTATEVNDGCNCTWSLTSVGTVNGVSRTITEIATQPTTSTVTNYSVWNYLYADSTASCLSISGGVTVAVPILARGSVCITGGGHFTGSQLKIGGTLTDTGGSNVGTSTTKISAVQIGGCTAYNTDGTCKTYTSTGCTVQPSSTYSVAPGTSWCDGTKSPLYATKVTGTLDVTPQMPCIGQSSTLDPTCPSSTASWSTLNTAYTTQKNATKTGCPANLLDNDSTLNKSLSASTLTGAMFPSNSSYDCKVVSGGTTIGEIKWNAVGQYCGTGTLTVSGTLYFDGSLNLQCGWKVQYTGQATLYFTGTVEQSGGTQLCGIAGCTNQWNPDTSGIIFIAGCWSNSTGTTTVSSKCVYVTGGSTAQWGAYATTAYQIDGGSSNMGPVLANTMNISGGSSTLIPFDVMPPGTPLNSQTQFVPAKVQSWSG